MRENTYIDFHDLPLLLTPSQVAELLGIPTDAAYDLIRKHGLPYTELDGQVSIRKDELICWLTGKEPTAKATSASGKMAVGKVGLPPEQIPKLANRSSITSSARPRLRSKKN